MAIGDRQDPQGKGTRDVLVIDDDRDLADSLARLLTLEGYGVTTAYSLREATERLAEQQVAVALVDIKLGQDDGVALLRHISRVHAGTTTIMMTAYASIDTAVEAMREGAYDYLCKPFYTEDLLATLKRCFERRRLVSEREEAEERLRRAQRMEAMGQLTGGVAHDFNNLLAVILGNLRLLQQEIGDRPDLNELIEEALGATKGGADLTRRLLAFGRDQPLHPQATDIGLLVHRLSRLLERTLGEGTSIDLDLAPDLWTAFVDRSQLESSLLNLAINARDAMPDGGRLLIRTRNGRLPTTEALPTPEALPRPTPGPCGPTSDRAVELSVIDSGGGMTDEVLGQAIQPFFTTKGAGQGSGLGLSMVYGFVTQSQGQLDIDSELGRGTCVTLRFPASLLGVGHDDREEERPEAAPSQGQGERILVVEDQAAVRRITCRQLTKLGYRVVEAADGRDALRVLAQTPEVDVLFTDIVLPGETNGFELSRQAVLSNPQLQVIYTTGHSPDAVTYAPADGSLPIILRKPVQVEELSRALRLTLAAD